MTKMIPWIALAFSLVAVAVSFYAIVIRASDDKAIYSLEVNSENICINGYLYTIRDDGKLDRDYKAQPSEIGDDGAEILQPALDVRCDEEA